jgi:hypothetical protein
VGGIIMCKEEFIHFMDKQIVEIEKYRKNKSNVSEKVDTNDCVFEWIENNAEKFREKWSKRIKFF